MHRRSLGRASALATVAVLAAAGLASADSVLGDANIVVDGAQGARYLGQFPASTEITVPVEFVMNCATSNHPDLGQTVALSLGSALVTGPGGEVVSMVPATIGPIAADWPDDGAGCPSTRSHPLRSTTGQVTLRTPSAAGVGYAYDIMFSRGVSPDGNNDASALGVRDPAVRFTLDVVANTPAGPDRRRRRDRRGRYDRRLDRRLGRRRQRHRRRGRSGPRLRLLARPGRDGGARRHDRHLRDDRQRRPRRRGRVRPARRGHRRPDHRRSRWRPGHHR